jgi:hypothetical protein
VNRRVTARDTLGDGMSLADVLLVVEHDVHRNGQGYDETSSRTGHERATRHR